VSQPADKVQPEASLAAQQNQLNYGFEKVQLRIYDTGKLAADNLAACASYEGHPYKVRVN